jgi:hypothetical protein
LALSVIGLFPFDSALRGSLREGYRASYAGHPRTGAMAARSSTLGAAAQEARQAGSPSFRPFDDRSPLVARQRTNT